MSTIVISDTHIGPVSQAYNELCRFILSLRSNPPEKLILNGDILEMWTCDERTALARGKHFFTGHIFPLIQRGTQVYYIFGNHDYSFQQEVANTYHNGGESAIDGLKDGLLNNGKDKLHFRFPHMVLKFNEATHREKHIFISHGDPVDFLYTFDRISKLNLPDIAYDINDDLFRKFLHAIRITDTYEFYSWIHNYPNKDHLTGIASPFTRKSAEGVLSVIFKFLTSYMLHEILRRAGLNPGNYSGLIQGALSYSQELQAFARECYTVDFNDMRIRMIESIGSRWQEKIFSNEGWWNYYGNNNENKIEPNKISTIIIGHTHKPGDNNADNIRLISNGSWCEGDGINGWHYVEIDKDGNSGIKVFL